MQLNNKLSFLYIVAGTFFVGGFTSTVQNRHGYLGVSNHQNKPLEFGNIGRLININIFMNNESSSEENVLDCREGFNFINNACYQLPKKLHVSCDASNVCKTPFSECVDGKCQCKQNYIKHENLCYGLLNANCSRPSDCMSTSYSCQSGTCQNVDYEKNGKLLSSKPGISAYWVNKNNHSDVTGGVYAGADNGALICVCRGTRNGIKKPGKLIDWTWGNRCDAIYGTEELFFYDYEMLVGSNVAWMDSSITFDKAVYGGSTDDNKPLLVCRVFHIGLAVVGKLEPPLYDTCIVPFSGGFTYFDKFDVLVHE